MIDAIVDEAVWEERQNDLLERLIKFGLYSDNPATGDKKIIFLTPEAEEFFRRAYEQD